MEFFLKPGDPPFCLDITLMDDDMIEGREFFLVALRDLLWGEIIETAVVTINDDDGKSLAPSDHLSPSQNEFSPILYYLNLCSK